MIGNDLPNNCLYQREIASCVKAIREFARGASGPSGRKHRDRASEKSDPGRNRACRRSQVRGVKSGARIADFEAKLVACITKDANIDTALARELNRVIEQTAHCQAKA